jgi:hypothetical protein
MMTLRQTKWSGPLAAVMLCTAVAVHAQAPVEERGRTLQQGQYRAGIAHRALEQARYDAKLAEQDVLNARDAHSAAQQQAAARKSELEAAEKALAAARARVAAAQRDYDSEVSAVDATHRAAKQVPLGGAAPAPVAK